jgi:hypothetical protein
MGGKYYLIIFPTFLSLLGFFTPFFPFSYRNGPRQHAGALLPWSGRQVLSLCHPPWYALGAVSEYALPPAGINSLADGLNQGSYSFVVDALIKALNIANKDISNRNDRAHTARH